MGWRWLSINIRFKFLRERDWPIYVFYLDGGIGVKKEKDNKTKTKSSKNIFAQMKDWFAFFPKAFVKGDALTKLSFVIMGSSNLFRGQIFKGLLFLLIEISYVFYLVTAGISSFTGLVTLGTKEQGMVMDEELGIFTIQQGDNSMLMLLAGVVAISTTVIFIFMWRANIKSAYSVQLIKKSGNKVPSLKEDIARYFNSDLHKSLLALPLTGIFLFNLLPLFFMILIAFTNFDNSHQPPGNLFTWVAFENFYKILLSGEIIAKTFWPVLGWTIIWAVFATFLNYILGILLALLINREGVKFKEFWRTIFVLSIAIPQFVSLLIFKLMLNNSGPVNELLRQLGFLGEGEFLPFLTNPTWARVTVIVVNLWVGIPHTMLIVTGVLSNIPRELYDAAKVDGAGPLAIFFKILMPYIVFVTQPQLITQFIGNINNFNVIYFLTGGGPNTLDYYQAGKTDLLVTWLYKLTTGSMKDYNYASTIGILVFIISATFSLLAFHRTSSYKSEEEFQ